MHPIVTPNTQQALRGAVASLRHQGVDFFYCYVRMKGLNLGKPPSIKVFYTDETTVAHFAQYTKRLGMVKAVEFPTDHRPPEDEELAVAINEGRVVL